MTPSPTLTVTPTSTATPSATPTPTVTVTSTVSATPLPVAATLDAGQFDLLMLAFGLVLFLSAAALIAGLRR